MHRPHAGLRRRAQSQHASVGRSGARTKTVFRNRSGMSLPTSSTLKNRFAPFDQALQSAFENNIRAALAEDVGSGDLTGMLVPADEMVKARVIVREEAVLCGAPWFEALMQRVDSRIRIDWHYAEGDLMR